MAVVIRSESHSENFRQEEVSNILLKYIDLLHYDPNKKIHWLGDIDQLKSLVSDLFGSSDKWSSPGGYAKSFCNVKICVTWYSNKRTLVFNGVLGSLFKKLTTDLLNNGCSKDAAISNVDASNYNVDHDVNGI